MVSKSGQNIDYLNVVVSAKAADAGEQLPFHTRCWISSGIKTLIPIFFQWKNLPAAIYVI